jgi:mRNA interferase MazF
MGALAAGQVVLLPFPFSDLSRNKLRPVLLLASAGREDWIDCQITSNPYADPGAIPLMQTDFASGGLQRISYVRPSKLFTAHESLIAASTGLVHSAVLQHVRGEVIAVIRETGSRSSVP